FSVFPAGDKVYYVGEPDELMGNRRYGWTGNAFLRVYTADRGQDNSLSMPTIAEAYINNERYHIGPIASNHSGNSLFITRTYPGDDGERTKENGRKYLTNRLELYLYTQENGSWQ